MTDRLGCREWLDGEDGDHPASYSVLPEVENHTGKTQPPRLGYDWANDVRWHRDGRKMVEVQGLRHLAG
ncbi:MAG: hypothetical protein OXI05_01045 [Bacteroidota bacterium]|nr:hypothetical protein [Bacteroidota bacterium]MXW15570.1 hypothetical protein [Rhodothermaceae bacterium]MDE2644413.1 hypothetical protein [Bacteroidota bacterium]MXW33035.1 hypothetical protein [Rhodothermaceae bacterium]MYC03507.1 hypothetical protein [Rhodothermaceae bacterium]